MTCLKTEAMKQQVFRKCCRCKETKRVATDFTPTNKRCKPCAAIYYKDLQERRANGEPAWERAPRNPQHERPALLHEFRWFFTISAVGGGDGNAPARA